VQTATQAQVNAEQAPKRVNVQADPLAHRPAAGIASGGAYRRKSSSPTTAGVVTRRFFVRKMQKLKPANGVNAQIHWTVKREMTHARSSDGFKKISNAIQNLFCSVTF
jgi:hypothetical protein